MRLERKVARGLTVRNKTLAVAESCSGGLLSHRITNVPGSSKFFKLALITYHDQAKIKLLKIPPAVLKRYGAVSQPVARRMAESVRRILRTDLGIGITGIAGPSGGTPEKPVGLTFIAISSTTKTVVRKFRFRGGRPAIKSQAATQALRMLCTFLT